MPSAGSGMAAPYMPDPLSNYDETGNRTAPPQYSREEMNAATLANRQADPNWIRGKTFDAMTAMGADPGQASLLSAPFAFAPGIGDAQDAEDAGRAYASGDYLTGGLMTAMAIAPFASAQGVRLLKKGMNEAGEEVVQKGIKAYHGSPHDFDAFDINKIGTGEGAQAYGHGLYFADNESVARAYRDNLSGANLDYRNYFDANGPANITAAQTNALAAMEDVNVRGDRARQILKHIDDAMQEGIRPEDYLKEFDVAPSLHDGYKAAIEQLKGIRYEYNPGRMYEVNINANPDDFLDWDKPLSQQSAQNQERLRSIGLNADPNGVRAYDDALLAALTNDGPTDLPKLPHDPSGESIVRNYGETRIKDAGIPGIKYLDQGSRTAGEGSRNYVVFDDKLIEIVKKYGIVGAVAAGLLTKEQGDALAAQMQDETAMQKEAN